MQNRAKMAFLVHRGIRTGPESHGEEGQILQKAFPIAPWGPRGAVLARHTRKALPKQPPKQLHHRRTKARERGRESRTKKAKLARARERMAKGNRRRAKPRAKGRKAKTMGKAKARKVAQKAKGMADKVAESKTTSSK